MAYFNSHPHEEDDHLNFSKSFGNSISTHILTKRMTGNVYQVNWTLSISTHILTKRMTSLQFTNNVLPSISTHILTKRMTIYGCDRMEGIRISTHILTKRMTCCDVVSACIPVFQLTSSRRG